MSEDGQGSSPLLHIDLSFSNPGEFIEGGTQFFTDSTLNLSPLELATDDIQRRQGSPLTRVELYQYRTYLLPGQTILPHLSQTINPFTVIITSRDPTTPSPRRPR